VIRGSDQYAVPPGSTVGSPESWEPGSGCTVTVEVDVLSSRSRAPDSTTATVTPGTAGSTAKTRGRLADEVSPPACAAATPAAVVGRKTAASNAVTIA